MDLRPQTDHRGADVGVLDAAAIRNEHMLQVTVLHGGAGQEAGVGVDGFIGVEKVELGVRTGEHQVGLVERAYRPDIRPVAFEPVAEHGMVLDGVGDDMCAEIIEGFLLQQVAEQFCIEEVDAHRAQEGTLGVAAAHHFVQYLGLFGLFGEPGDLPAFILLEDAQPPGFLPGYRLDRHSDTRTGLEMEFRHLGIVHAVQMVACQDEHVLGTRRADLE